MPVIRTEYTEADFARAVEVIRRERSFAPVFEALGIEWDYLVWLALGVAQESLGRTSAGLPEALANGAEAFTAGLLIGIHLPERRDTPADLGLSVAWAIDEVRERGRRAIIAEHCTGQTIATLEYVVVGALVEGLRLTGPRGTGLGAACTRLLEAGLATGLVLTREDVPAAR